MTTEKVLFDKQVVKLFLNSLGKHLNMPSTKLVYEFSAEAFPYECDFKKLFMSLKEKTENGNIAKSFAARAIACIENEVCGYEAEYDEGIFIDKLFTAMQEEKSVDEFIAEYEAYKAEDDDTDNDNGLNETDSQNKEGNEPSNDKDTVATTEEIKEDPEAVIEDKKPEEENFEEDNSNKAAEVPQEDNEKKEVKVAKQSKPTNALDTLFKATGAYKALVEGIGLVEEGLLNETEEPLNAIKELQKLVEAHNKLMREFGPEITAALELSK